MLIKNTSVSMLDFPHTILSFMEYKSELIQPIKLRLLLNVSNEQNLLYGHTINVHCSSDGY